MQKNEFTVCHKKLKEFFGEDFDYVSLRFTMPCQDFDTSSTESILETSVFAGILSIIDGRIIPLDGDTYDEDYEVLAYRRWTDEKNEVKNGLTVVVFMQWETAKR